MTRSTAAADDVGGEPRDERSVRAATKPGPEMACDVCEGDRDSEDIIGFDTPEGDGCIASARAVGFALAAVASPPGEGVTAADEVRECTGCGLALPELNMGPTTEGLPLRCDPPDDGPVQNAAFVESRWMAP